MFIEERHKEILRIIETLGRISIGDIEERFGVSLDSARRDLRILEEKGLLKRTYGGAIKSTQVRHLPANPGLCRDMRNIQFTDNYLAIAQEAAGYIHEADAIFLSGGSLAFAMLKFMPRNIQYTLVTHSVTLAEELKGWENVNVYVTGGRMSHIETATFEDSFAISFVSNMHFDLSIIATGAGLDADFGLTLLGDDTATLLRTVMCNSRKNILIMPKQKIGFKGFVKVCDVNAFDTLITDWDAVEDQLEKIRELGVEVVIAKKE